MPRTSESTRSPSPRAHEVPHAALSISPRRGRVQQDGLPFSQRARPLRAPVRSGVEGLIKLGTGNRPPFRTGPFTTNLIRSTSLTHLRLVCFSDRFRAPAPRSARRQTPHLALQGIRPSGRRLLQASSLRRCVRPHVEEVWPPGPSPCKSLTFWLALLWGQKCNAGNVFSLTVTLCHVPGTDPGPHNRPHDLS